MSKRKAMSTEKARYVRKKGHDDAKIFAKLIGLSSDYQNDPKAKKDVIDLSGDAHSVKSGTKRWQLFLYGINRIKNDDFFQTMNGIGQLLIECVQAFPNNIQEYLKDKQAAKERCRIPMRKLKELLQEKRRVRAFINKAMFNGGEVDYLTVKDENKYHVFLNNDVISAFANSIEVENSKAITKNQIPEQKVIFKFHGTNLAELEIRNSGENHYREILFVMNKRKMMELLYENIPQTNVYNDKVLVYGNATKKFGRWKQKNSNRK
ncbi:MAG: hypothetical protein LC122_07795 [Chitinophagales bacterium]|nr:hypothetical protein [Chitinophagales bacterium]